MKTIKFFSFIGTIGALLLLSGYDCPECDYRKQTTALVLCIAVSVICGLIAAKNDNHGRTL